MNRVKNLINHKYGKLTVIEYIGSDSNGRSLWRCKCECGNIATVKSSQLINGRTKSCGCLRTKDLTGKRFGRLTVIYRDNNHVTSGGKQQVAWHCVCDCGNEINVKADNLRSGNTKSCGCLSIDTTISNSTIHGKCHTRIYNIWKGMKQRCNYSGHVNYQNYGGRGITVCVEWENDFQSFYDWTITNGYSKELTIDRIDVNGNYEPNNCRWIPISEQSLNRTDNHCITFNGNKRTVTEWGRLTGINRYTITCRLKRGWSVEDALTIKPKENKLATVKRKEMYEEIIN